MLPLPLTQFVVFCFPNYYSRRLKDSVSLALTVRMKEQGYPVGGGEGRRRSAVKAYCYWMPGWWMGQNHRFPLAPVPPTPYLGRSGLGPPRSAVRLEGLVSEREEQQILALVEWILELALGMVRLWAWA